MSDAQEAKAGAPNNFMLPITSREPSTADSDYRDTESIRAVYEEVCNSYHAIDDFRMKLLGFLPLTSVVGLLLAEKGILSTSNAAPPLLVAYISFFASA